MAINLYALNVPEAVLTKPEAKPVSYRVDADRFKENWEEIKSNSKNLMQVSQNVTGCEATLSIEGLKSVGEVNRNYCNYSSDVFFQKNMPQVTTNGGYMVGGVNFSKEELEQCRMVMRTAVDGIGCGIGKNTNIDYRNYAQMGIAVSGVKTYAGENLSEEQAAVVNKAMQEYMEALVDLEDEMLSKDGYVDSDNGTLSEYYGKVKVLDDGEIDTINKLKEELSRITGHYYAPTQKGVTAMIQSATNKKLSSEIVDLFSNMDSTDESSVQEAIEKYKELVRPAYTAYGMNDGYGSLSRVLDGDAADFRKQIANIMLAARYHAADYSV